MAEEHAGTVDNELLTKLEQALFEIRRVIAGQEEMLERVLVCLLAGGHLLIEGVPGLAKTLTIKSTASVLGGTFKRIQFTPDLVPSDLVGTRVFRPDKHDFDGRRRAHCKIDTRDRENNSVVLGIETKGGKRVIIDFGRDHRVCAGFASRNRHQA